MTEDTGSELALRWTLFTSLGGCCVCSLAEVTIMKPDNLGRGGFLPVQPLSVRVSPE